MIEQFYTVMDGLDNYMYRSGLVWRGGNFPRATGCVGTLAKAQVLLGKVVTAQEREVDRILDQAAQWCRGSHTDQEAKDMQMSWAKERAEAYGATTYRIVKITVEDAY